MVCGRKSPPNFDVHQRFTQQWVVFFLVTLETAPKKSTLKKTQTHSTVRPLVALMDDSCPTGRRSDVETANSMVPNLALVFFGSASLFLFVLFEPSLFFVWLGGGRWRLGLFCVVLVCLVLPGAVARSAHPHTNTAFASSSGLGSCSFQSSLQKQGRSQLVASRGVVDFPFSDPFKHVASIGLLNSSFQSSFSMKTCSFPDLG